MDLKEYELDFLNIFEKLKLKNEKEIITKGDSMDYSNVNSKEELILSNLNKNGFFAISNDKKSNAFPFYIVTEKGVLYYYRLLFCKSPLTFLT